MPFYQPCLFHYTLYVGGTAFILIRKCLPLGMEEYIIEILRLKDDVLLGPYNYRKPRIYRKPPKTT